MTPEPICDFCSSKPVEWSYPCRSHDTTEPMPPGHILDDITLNSHGWWAACGPCHDLIEATDREGLAQRSFEVTPGDFNEILGEAVMPFIRHAHDNFWSNRDGEAVTLEDTPDWVLREAGQ